MAQFIIDVPNYSPSKGAVAEWEAGFEIVVRLNDGHIVIGANKAGLISLAKQLLFLAQDDVPEGTHYHFDEYGSLEPGSVELVVEKV